MPCRRSAPLTASPATVEKKAHITECSLCRPVDQPHFRSRCALVLILAGGLFETQWCLRSYCDNMSHNKSPAECAGQSYKSRARRAFLFALQSGELMGQICSRPSGFNLVCCSWPVRVRPEEVRGSLLRDARKLVVYNRLLVARARTPWSEFEPCRS